MIFAPIAETPFLQRNVGGDRRWVLGSNNAGLMERHANAQGLPTLRTIPTGRARFMTACWRANKFLSKKSTTCLPRWVVCHATPLGLPDQILRSRVPASPSIPMLSCPRGAPMYKCACPIQRVYLVWKVPAGMQVLETAKISSNINFLSAYMVRVEGLEPPRLAAPEPKSGASTNFATPAKDRKRPVAVPAKPALQ